MRLTKKSAQTLVISSVMISTSLIILRMYIDAQQHRAEHERRELINQMDNTANTTYILEVKTKDWYPGWKQVIDEPKSYDEMISFLSDKNFSVQKYRIKPVGPKVPEVVQKPTRIRTSDDRQRRIPDNIKKTQTKKIIGHWLEKVPNLPEYDHTIIIKKTSSGYVMETHMKDGSVGSRRLIEYFVNGKRRFREPGNTYGEYYVIDNSGGLGMYDREGYIKTASPLPH